MKFLKFPTILIFLFFWSCQVNYPILQPWKNDVSKRNFSWKEQKDSIHLKISGENLQPIFFKNKDTLQRGFIIQSFYFQGNEGRKINAWLLKPKKNSAVKSVFALHGNAGNISTHFENFANLMYFGF